MNLGTVLFDVFVLLGVAFLLGVFFERLKQSAILGYLAAGTLLGPSLLNLVQSATVVSSLAELGVALLLFTLGLEFSWTKLKRLGGLGLVGRTAQVLLTLIACAGVSRFLGFSWPVSLCFGAIVAPSSTATVLRLLMDRGDLESIPGKNSLAVLLLQDLAIVPLVVFVGLLSSGGWDQQSLVKILQGIGVTIGFVLFFYVFIHHLLPKVLSTTALLKNQELLILIAVVTCIGAVSAAHYVGLPVSLGAFVAGLLLGESQFATQIRADVGALRTLFVTLFFVSIGMLADLFWISRHLGLLAGTVSLILVGKAAIIWFVFRRLKNTHRHAFATAIGLSQIGEFGLVIAQLGLQSELLSMDHFRLWVSSILVTLFLTPLLVSKSAPLGDWLAGILRRIGLADATAPPSPVAFPVHEEMVLLIGFGPAGRRIARALKENGIAVVVLELNPRALEEIRTEGHSAVLGDASRPEVLESAHLGKANAVVVTIPDTRSAQQVIGVIRSLMPQMMIFARGRYGMYTDQLTTAGAQIVIDEEELIGERLGAEVVARCRPLPKPPEI